MTDSDVLAAHAVGSAVPLDDDALLDVLVGLPDPVIVLEGTGAVVWGNEAAESFFGLSVAASLGMAGLDLVHPDDLEFALLSMLSVQEKSRGKPIEVRLRSAEGWRLVEVIGAPLRSGDDLVVLSIRDLTERRGFEVASDDVAKFRSLVHNAATLTMLISSTGVVEAASGALARLLGRDPGVVVGRPLVDLLAAEERATLEAALEASALGAQGAGDAPTVEVGLQHLAGGDPIPFELTIVNLLEDPTVRGFVVSGHDITARTTAEAALHSTLSLLNATLDSTHEGILVVDREGAITRVNRKFAELWRIPEDVLGTQDDAAAIDFVLRQLAEPELFVAKIAELYARPEAESHDVLHFLDGRIFERDSRPQLVDGEIVGRVWSFRDVTARKQLERQLAHQALHDPLTNLANQTLFRDRLEHALARLQHSGGDLAVLFLDLDNFKTVNDSLGHPAGDLLLLGVTERLEQCLRSADTAARLGGDEFAVLLEDAASEQDVTEVADRILRAFKQTFSVDGTEVSASVSIGIAFATPGSSCDQLLRDADLAMYTAKRRGKGRHAAYEPGMHATAVERLQVEAELRKATLRGELLPHYQPIVDLVSARIVAVEALVRWRHPVRGLLRPDAFLALAEESGLIEDISELILIQACTDLRCWIGEGIVPPDFAISVNLAAKQLARPDLVATVDSVLADTGIQPTSLILEITEGAMMRDTDAAIAVLVELRARGVRIAVDDFGTGYSSLAYLRRFPIDILKIDKSFVDGIDGGPEESALPHAIIRLADTLHLTTIAEGVERESQRASLRRLGCELAQGYHLGLPVPAEALTTMLRATGGIAHSSAPTSHQLATGAANRPASPASPLGARRAGGR